MTRPTLLRVRNLRTSFGQGDNAVEVVKGVSFDLAEGEVLGLIGESGSGKTMTGLSILQLAPGRARLAADELTYRGKPLLQLPPEEVRALRGVELAMIFQDPVGSFNPAKTIRWHLEQALLRAAGKRPQDLRQRCVALLKGVQIRDPDRTLASFPHQLSGGMLQRVLIALIFGLEPRLVIADEPTTNLDNLVERQILDLIHTHQRETGTGVLFITHDLTVARHLCDRIAVMYSGKIVEMGPTEKILENPAHPYTVGLLATARSLANRDETLFEIKGEPSAPDWHGRCAFSPRCDAVRDVCLGRAPGEVELENNHAVRCFNHAG